MKIILNGEEQVLENELNIIQLLTKYKLEPEIIVVEKNGEIINKDLYADETVTEGDKIELIRFIGGG